MDPNYSLPLNVALITLQVMAQITILSCSLSLSPPLPLLTIALQELDDGSILLRLAHLYEVKGPPLLIRNIEHRGASLVASLQLKLRGSFCVIK